MNDLEMQELNGGGSSAAGSWKRKFLLVLAAVVVLVGAAYAVYHFTEDTSEPPAWLAAQIEDLELELQNAVRDQDIMAIRMSMAECYMEADMCDEAVEQFEKALDLATDDQEIAAIRITMARAYWKAEMHDEALDQLDLALPLAPENIRGLWLKGRIYIDLEEYDEAIEPCLKVIEVFEVNQYTPSFELNDAHYCAALAYLEKDDPDADEALSLLEDMMSLPDTFINADLRALHAKAYQVKGDYEQAVDLYLEALRFGPYFPEAYQGLKECYSNLNQPHHVMYAEGMLSYCSEDYEEAIRKLQDAKSNIPEFGKVWEGVGVAYEANGQITEAIEEYEQAVALDPYMCVYAAMQLNSLGQ